MALQPGTPTSAIPGLFESGIAGDPWDSSGALPSSAPPAGPAAPPSPAGGGTPDPSSQVNTMTQRIMQALAQQAQQKRFAGTPVPGSIPGQVDPAEARSIGMNTANPHAWGAQRFMAGLQGMIQNAVSKKKEGELLKAEGDWSYLQTSLNDLYAAQASKDPEAIKQAQAKVDVMMSDPKKLKNMAKALNQDWLNPEKTTVYGEALKKVNAKTQQTDAQKDQARQGIKGLFQKLLQRQQRPQLSPEQQKAMGQEIQAKAPTTTGGATVKEQVEAAKGILDLEKASKEARENYQFITAPDGNIWAVNKTNPKDAYQVRDTQTGKEVTGQTKPSAAPKVLSANNIPYGIQRGGKLLTPESLEWSKEDQTAFDGAMSTAKEKQQLRIDPIIGDQLGAPPLPKNYAKGDRDPAYYAALKKYGQEAELIKNRMAATSGAARAKAFNEYRPVQVVDYDANGDPVIKYTTAKAAIEGGLAGAEVGAKMLSKTKQIEDIDFSSKKLREAVNKMDRPFNAQQIAKLETALKAPDETIANAEIQAIATESLTDAQQDFVLWVKHLNERAMSLRNIAGQGQGAQDTRDAIRALLPGAATGDKKMMLKMMDAFDNQTKILKSGIPKAGAGPAKKGTPITMDEAGDYLRKAGGDKAKARQLAKADGRTF